MLPRGKLNRIQEKRKPCNQYSKLKSNNATYEEYKRKETERKKLAKLGKAAVVNN